MNRLLIIALSLVCFCALPWGSSAAPRPNLIWIMADDLGYSELGA